MEKIEIVRDIGIIQANLIVIGSSIKDSEKRATLENINDMLTKISDSIISEAKNGAN
jgi:hypothetical protein